MGERSRLTASAARALPPMLGRFIKDRQGVTAIEFAFVAPPFFIIVLGVLTIAMQFFTILMLEVGVEQAARKLRTGQAQTQGMNLGDFKTLVCDAAGGAIACDGNLQVLVSSGATFAALGSGPSCVTGSSMTQSAASGTSVSSLTGSDGRAVMVTVCYTWSAGTTLWKTLKNFVSVAPLVNGQSIISARSMFRLES